MKVKLFLTIFLTFLGLTSVTNAQNVNIPDANFKNYLLGNTAINTNGDGQIQVSEAAAYTGTINVFYKNIADLTGIAAFTALKILNCDNNHLTSLNVSANTALTNLYCAGNQLTSLNISGLTALDTLGCSNNLLTNLNVSTNTALSQLLCDGNQLTSLNVFANTALTELEPWSNQLTSLDVSANTALTILDCSNNHLTSLNVQNGNNTNFVLYYSFDARHNPNLTCIQVDNTAWANSAWANRKDSTASFSQNCIGAVIDNPLKDVETAIYPNPTNGIFKITSNTTDKLTVDLYDVNSRRVLSKSVVGTADIDANSLDNGIYTLTMKSSAGITNKKLVITR